MPTRRAASSTSPQTAGTVVAISVEGRHARAGQPGAGSSTLTTPEVAYQQAVASLANTVRQVRGRTQQRGGRAGRHRRPPGRGGAGRADVARRGPVVATGAVSAEGWPTRAQLQAAEAALSASRAGNCRATVRWSMPPPSPTSRRCRRPPRNCAGLPGRAAVRDRFADRRLRRRAQRAARPARATRRRADDGHPLHESLGRGELPGNPAARCAAGPAGHAHRRRLRRRRGVRRQAGRPGPGHRQRIPCCRRRTPAALDQIVQRIPDRWTRSSSPRTCCAWA